MTAYQTLHRPDPVTCGCDTAPGLLPVDQAIARGLALVSPVPEVETLPLAAATGRVLARDIAAPVPLPLFDNAAMDGYACRSGDLSGQGPWVLPVAGCARAGDVPTPLPNGSAMRILTAALDRPCIDRIPLPACADDPEALRELVAQAAAQADIMITTGGVSVGDEDHMAAVIQDLGGRIEVTKLAMKPGKPLSLGQIGHALWLGLPGNPVAAFVTWHVIGQVLAGRMAGLSDPGPARTLAALGAPIRHKPGRCEYRPARLPGHDARGVAQVICLDGAGSHRVAQLAGADALVMIPADVEAMSRGDLVEVLPL